MRRLRLRADWHGTVMFWFGWLGASAWTVLVLATQPAFLYIPPVERSCATADVPTALPVPVRSQAVSSPIADGYETIVRTRAEPPILEEPWPVSRIERSAVAVNLAAIGTAVVLVPPVR